jgi:hypothetical protein
LTAYATGSVREFRRFEYLTLPVGLTGVLTVAARREIAPLLEPLGRSDVPPWPQPLPAAWLGQFNRPEPLAYTPVLPLLVAEVTVDQAYEAGRWRHHARYLRLRADLQPADVTPWSVETPGSDTGEPH